MLIFLRARWTYSAKRFEERKDKEGCDIIERDWMIKTLSKQTKLELEFSSVSAD